MYAVLENSLRSPRPSPDNVYRWLYLKEVFRLFFKNSNKTKHARAQCVYKYYNIRIVVVLPTPKRRVRTRAHACTSMMYTYILLYVYRDTIKLVNDFNVYKRIRRKGMKMKTGSTPYLVQKKKKVS